MGLVWFGLNAYLPTSQYLHSNASTLVVIFSIRVERTIRIGAPYFDGRQGMPTREAAPYQHTELPRLLCNVPWFEAASGIIYGARPAEAARSVVTCT